MSEPSPETREQRREVAQTDEAAFNAAFGGAAEGQVRCVVCGTPQPLTEIPYGDTATAYKCAECQKAEHAVASHEGREAALNRGSQMLAERIGQIIEGKKPLTHAPHITEYLDEIVRQCGGTPFVVSRWLRQLEHAEESKPGSKTVLDQYQFIGKLILYSTEHRATAPDVTSLSNEQLLLEKQRLQMKLLLDQIKDLATPSQRNSINQVLLKLASPDEGEAA